MSSGEASEIKELVEEEDKQTSQEEGPKYQEEKGQEEKGQEKQKQKQQQNQKQQHQKQQSQKQQNQKQQQSQKQQNQNQQQNQKQQQQQSQKQQSQKQQQQNQNQQQNQKQQQQQNQNQQNQNQALQPQTRKRQVSVTGKKKANPSTHLQFDNPQKRKQATKKQIVQMKVEQKQCTIFSHLPQYERPTSVSLATRFTETIHPAIISLGLKYASKQIQGSSARCIAMLDAFEIVIKDYENPPEKPLAMDLDAKMKPLIQFLTDCRPLSFGMGNAIKHLKHSIGRTTKESPAEAKQEILEDLNRYRKTLLSAVDLIEETGVKKITDGDVVLVYAASHIVFRILTKAHFMGKKFSVIVVDSNPKYEGRVLLSRLVDFGIKCSYALLTAVSYLIKEVTKVVLGAHSLMGNGAVVSRTGSAVVAMMAHANNVPILVACETFKFFRRPQLDSICWNVLEDPDNLLSNPMQKDTESANTLQHWRDIDKLVLLNLAYDITPIDYVSAVVTEVGLIPPTSVPVVIREAEQKKVVEGIC